MRIPSLSLVLRLSLSFAFCATFTAAAPVFAQDDDLDDDLDDEDDLDGDDEEGEGGSAPKEGEAMAGAQEGGEVAEDSLGGATGFEIRTGFYMSSELGGFFRLGGWGDSKDTLQRRTIGKVYSNLQPWIGLTLGYDFLPFLGAEVTLGSGFVSDAALLQGNTESPENYAINMVNVAVTGSYYFGRLAITGKGFVGGTFLAPAPAPDALPLGGQIGASVGVRYATLLTDVTIGFDMNAYVVVAPGGGELNLGTFIVPGGAPFFPAFSFAPVIKYTF
ncbi:MAG: adventurous gliding motility protein CglE [Deltaproteobacteria bacterium]|nr:adventurous gliding motility protein CglE [Deltaproteobacteria bacterium]